MEQLYENIWLPGGPVWANRNTAAVPEQTACGVSMAVSAVPHEPKPNRRMLVQERAARRKQHRKDDDDDQRRSWAEQQVHKPLCARNNHYGSLQRWRIDPQHPISYRTQISQWSGAIHRPVHGQSQEDGVSHSGGSPDRQSRNSRWTASKRIRHRPPRSHVVCGRAELFRTATDVQLRPMRPSEWRAVRHVQPLQYQRHGEPVFVTGRAGPWAHGPGWAWAWAGPTIWWYQRAPDGPGLRNFQSFV